MQSIAQKLYHGTCTKAMADIVSHGLVPCGGRGCDSWAHRRKWAHITDAPARTDSIYLTATAGRARDYAIIAASVNEGSQPMLIEIKAEGLDVVPDELDKIAMRYAGSIEPARFGTISVFKGHLVMGNLFRGRY